MAYLRDEIQLRVLALLEEASQEDLQTLLITVRRPQGLTTEVTRFGEALTELVTKGYVLLNMRLDDGFKELSPTKLQTLSSERALKLLSDLQVLFEWSTANQLWVWRRRTGRLEAELTEAGLSVARKVLTDHGYHLAERPER